jgi:RIO-like serine/threonine protein kinase
MLSDTKITMRIEKNVIQAFKILHSHGICHGDVRAANVLVRKDESVVLIDFERSVLNVDRMMVLEEEDEVRHMLQFAKSMSHG